MGLKGKIFIRKPADKYLYKWSPIPTEKKINERNGNSKFFCNATPNSQGEDWVTTYVYELIIIKGIKRKEAYVECDYVE